MPKISSYTQSVLIPGDDLIVARNGNNYKVDLEYGARIVWDSATGYHIESGARGVGGSGLIWTSNITRSSLSLSAATLYYVYLYSNAGTPAVEESTTAPTFNTTYRYWQKTGDATRRCVGALRTDGSSNIYRFHTVMNGNTLEYVYESGANSSTPFLLVSATGSASAWTSINLAGLCPANAFQWYCAPKIVFANDGDDGILSVIPIDLGAGVSAGAGSYTIRTAIGRASSKLFTGRAWINIVTAQTAYYRTQNLTGTITADIEIHGFKMEM